MKNVDAAGRARQVATTCALRFDGWRWLAEHWPNADGSFSELTGPIVATLAFPSDDAGCQAAFFALQRWLFKWGGETLPDDAPVWIAFWHLYLRVYRVEVGETYVARQHVNAWNALDPHSMEGAAAFARREVMRLGAAGVLGFSLSELVWDRLGKQQIGRYAEHYVKFELVRAGYEVFTTEVDDRGIDLVVRGPDLVFRTVQVKAVRNDQSVYLNKVSFSTTDGGLLAIVDLENECLPVVCVIPARDVGQASELFGEWKDTKTGKDWWFVKFKKKSRALLREQYRLKTIATET